MDLCEKPLNHFLDSSKCAKLAEYAIHIPGFIMPATATGACVAVNVLCNNKTKCLKRLNTGKTRPVDIQDSLPDSPLPIT